MLKKNVLMICKVYALNIFGLEDLDVLTGAEIFDSNCFPDVDFIYQRKYSSINYITKFLENNLDNNIYQNYN